MSREYNVLQELLEAVKCFGRTAYAPDMRENECGVMKHALRNAAGEVDFEKDTDKWVLLYRKGDMMLQHGFKEEDFLPWLEQQLEIEKVKRAVKAAEKKVNEKVASPPPPSKRPMRAAKANALQELSKTRKAAPGSTSTKRMAVATTTKDSAAAAAASKEEEEDDDDEEESDDDADDDDEYSWITNKIVKAYKQGTDHDKISDWERTMYLTQWRANMNKLGALFARLG